MTAQQTPYPEAVQRPSRAGAIVTLVIGAVLTIFGPILGILIGSFALVPQALGLAENTAHVAPTATVQPDAGESVFLLAPGRRPRSHRPQRLHGRSRRRHCGDGLLRAGQRAEHTGERQPLRVLRPRHGRRAGNLYARLRHQCRRDHGPAVRVRVVPRPARLVERRRRPRLAGRHRARDRRHRPGHAHPQICLNSQRTLRRSDVARAACRAWSPCARCRRHSHRLRWPSGSRRGSRCSTTSVTPPVGRGSGRAWLRAAQGRGPRLPRRARRVPTVGSSHESSSERSFASKEASFAPSPRTSTRGRLVVRLCRGGAERRWRRRSRQRTRRRRLLQRRAR